MKTATKFVLDSGRFDATRRLDAWRGILCDTYVGLDSDYADESFHSRIHGHAIGEYSLTRVTASSRYTVERSRTLIKRDGCELVFFGSCLSGSFGMAQAGRVAVVRPGVVAFNDATRPFQTHFADAVDMLWLGVPKKALADRVQTFEDLTAVAFRPTTPVQQIAVDFLSGLGPVLDRGVTGEDADALLNQAVDLFAMMITESASPKARHVATASLQATRLRRLKAHVEDHLHDPGLSALTAAAALSVSRDQVESLFALESTTFDQYVLARRLDGCHTYLSGVASLGVSLEEAAALWGFADAAQFRRAFRARFGATPADVASGRSRAPDGPSSDE